MTSGGYFAIGPDRFGRNEQSLPFLDPLSGRRVERINIILRQTVLARQSINGLFGLHYVYFCPATRLTGCRYYGHQHTRNQQDIKTFYPEYMICHGFPLSFLVLFIIR